MFIDYGPLSTKWYLQTKPPGYEIDGDITYYASRLQGVKGKVLEAGVGSGRMLIPLLQRGLDVEGVDASPHMLAACRRALNDASLHARLVEGDVTTLTMNEMYEAIIMPTGSFGLIASFKEAEIVLRHFYDHLMPGGRVIIDIEIMHDWKEGDITFHTLPFSDTEGMTLEIRNVRKDAVHQTTETYLTYEYWVNGRRTESELQRFTMRYYGIEELRLLLAAVGFERVTCSSDYEWGKQPPSEATLVTFEAMKR